MIWACCWFHPRFGLLSFFHDFWMLLRVRFSSSISDCVCFLLPFLDCVFPLAHRLKVVLPHFSVGVTFFSVCIKELCVWVLGCWTTANFHIRWLSFPMSMLGVWLLPTAYCVVVAIVSCVFGAVVFPWFWVASWLLRLQTSFGIVAELFWPC